MTDTLDPALEAALLPCPWCEANLQHVESWAKSFSPPRLYHEYKHPANDCLLSRKLWPFSDDASVRAAFVAAWNTRAAPQAEIDRLREDAERWRALMSSERLHFMGCAGFNIEGPHSVEDEGAPLATAHATPKPGAQLHFGMEFWSEFKWRSSEEAERYTDRFERDFMVVYVDEMRRRALHPETPNGGQHG